METTKPKPRSRIAPKIPTPHTLMPPYHQERPELEDVGRDIAHKTVRDTAEDVFENTFEGLVGNIFENDSQTLN